jgi:hypothetical protein
MSHAITQDILQAAEDNFFWVAIFLIVVGSL